MVLLQLRASLRRPVNIVKHLRFKSAMSSNSRIDSLFPNPSAPPSSLSPSHWPGVSAQTTKSLTEVLKDNHEKWHVFFNEMHFHNHAAHRALALWVLGADGATIEAGYKKDCDYEKPAFKSPEVITEENFTKHLGDEQFYNAYLVFFTKQIQDKGLAAVIEEYVFSKAVNIGASTNTPKKDRPQMLSRFLSGVIHPMIHTGYGAEFGLPGIVAEGLAQTAVHPAASTPLLPVSLFDTTLESDSSDNESPISAANKLVQSLSESLDAALAIDPTTPAKPVIAVPSSSKPPPLARTENSEAEDTHALSIIARILKDPHLGSTAGIDEAKLYASTIRKHGVAVAKYAAQWTIDVSRPGEIEKKMEEVAWANALIYSVGGWTGRGEEGFNADFFFMHLVTSSLFLPSLLAVIPSSSQALLLRAYFTVSLTWYVARGRPALDIPGFFASQHTSSHPDPAGPAPSPSAHVLSPEITNSNPWLPIIQTSLMHPDEHVPKLQRALAHWASLYGATNKGALGHTELPGAEELDGTMFLRAAGLTAERMGWVREGEDEAEFWDRKGFYVEK